MKQPTANGAQFGLKFSEMRKLLLDLEMGSDASIASRFRKLRPKFASDNLLSKRGNWVDYDLTRVLSICAIYSVNLISIPQGDAVSIVIRNWPEIARAFLVANSSLEAGDKTGPASAVRIYGDAFPMNDAIGNSWATATELPLANLSHIVLDCQPIVAALRTMRAGDELLQAAFLEIERTFGWEKLGNADALRLPDRLESGFFGTGPYFDRARALTSITFPDGLCTRERMRLQAYLAYLESPPPIDAWKQFIGTDDESPRLFHLLSVWGLELGLTSNRVASETLSAAAFPSRERALDLIERGERYLEGLIKARIQT